MEIKNSDISSDCMILTMNKTVVTEVVSSKGKLKLYPGALRSIHFKEFKVEKLLSFVNMSHLNPIHNILIFCCTKIFELERTDFYLFLYLLNSREVSPL